MSRKPTYTSRIEYLKAGLLEIAGQCEDVARDRTIDEAERRTWLTVAHCARNFATEKHAGTIGAQSNPEPSDASTTSADRT
jgi:hypothetical protein